MQHAVHETRHDSVRLLDYLAAVLIGSRRLPPLLACTSRATEPSRRSAPRFLLQVISSAIVAFALDHPAQVPRPRVGPIAVERTDRRTVRGDRPQRRDARRLRAQPAPRRPVQLPGARPPTRPTELAHDRRGRRCRRPARRRARLRRCPAGHVTTAQLPVEHRRQASGVGVTPHLSLQITIPSPYGAPRRAPDGSSGERPPRLPARRPAPASRACGTARRDRRRPSRRHP